MIEIYRVRGNPTPPLGIHLGQLIDLFPEKPFIDTVVLKKWCLHVPRNQGLVEIPHASHDILPMDMAIFGIHG